MNSASAGHSHLTAPATIRRWARRLPATVAMPGMDKGSEAVHRQRLTGIEGGYQCPRLFRHHIGIEKRARAHEVEGFSA